METVDYGSFVLRLEDPAAVIQGEPYDRVGWGPYQFPKLCRTRRGAILCVCTPPGAQDDLADYEGSARLYGMVSEDDGASWRPLNEGDEPVRVLLPDGHEYLPPKDANAFEADWLDKYTPDLRFDGKDPSGFDWPELYDADRVREYPRSPQAYEYDPATGRTEAFRLRVEWPRFAVQVFHRPDGKKLIYPMEMVLNDRIGHYMVEPDGTIFFCTYENGFNGMAGQAAKLYTVTVLRSTDRGRSWQWVSDVLTGPEHISDPRLTDGFCEPCMARMADGSVIMLMRTGSCCPSYLVRSVDDCKTWSRPQRFDSVGVLPRLLRLSCGVTLASYGRPGVYLRATADEKGLAWENPIDVGVPVADTGSCCYTSLLPLNDTQALLAYSHFHYPDAQGVPVKTILVRRVSVRLK